MCHRSRAHRQANTPDQRGAAAVLIAVSLVAMLGAVAFVVDVGNARMTRAGLGTAADAAALAASGELNDGESEAKACETAEAIANTNSPNAAVESCSTAVAASGTPIVTVVVGQHVEYAFAHVIGFSSTDVSARSSARHGEQGVVGARPFSVCIEALGALLGTWDPLGETSIGPIEVPYGKDSQPEACGDGDDVPGNWGSLDFNGGSNSTAEAKDWIENGYSGTVYPPTSIDGDPGALSGSVASALGSLVSSEEVFPLPLFSSASGNGANAVFEVLGFINAQLVDYDVNGSAASRTLTFVFHPGQYPGVPCCDPDGAVVELFNEGLCATTEETDAC